jgi:hypothetical protein
MRHVILVERDCEEYISYIGEVLAKAARIRIKTLRTQRNAFCFYLAKTPRIAKDAK